jgi:two-component system sensor histidine kinase MtrB
VHSLRTRLTVTIVALVAITAVVLGAGTYAYVDRSLHDQALDDAEAQARFDLSILVPSVLASAPPTRDQLAELSAALDRRGVGTVVDLGPGEPYVSRLELLDSLDRLSGELRQRVATGELAFEWTRLATGPSLVVGGRVQTDGPAIYFVHDVAAIERTLADLRLALSAGSLALVLVAVLAARRLARGVLVPVETAGRVAERIEAGDLTARVPVTSRDEFGLWAARFNRMAQAMDGLVGRLEASQAQNRRFVADVSHELRTPLTALVAEASILREGLAELPPAPRRAGELLVQDVARLRTLVDELMELSRFDANAERLALETVDLRAVVSHSVAARAPSARIFMPEEPVMVDVEPRRVERILANLLDNAREHAPDTPVEVTLDNRPGEIVLAVADHGPGVPPDRLERIFERFFKADTSRAGGSSGLGLAIAKEHATLLGATLLAANGADGGLRVELRWPVTGSLPAGDPPETRPLDARAPHVTPSESEP